MTTNHLERLLGSLSDVSETAGGGWEARCPAHEDRRASLSISTGDDGRVLLYCHAGCSAQAVVDAVGLRLADLFPSANGKPNGKPKATTRKSKGRIVATYDYRDEASEVLFQVCRFEPKNFVQRRPKPGGGWEWRVKGTRQVPFRLPELLAAPDRLVVVPEGEKDVLALERIGVLGTCNAGGAGKWTSKHAEFLRGRNVVIIPDNDRAGREHAEDVARSLQGLASRVRVVHLPDLPEKGDVSDWLGAGNAQAELRKLIAAAADWEPTAAPVSLESDPGMVKRLADAICEQDHFAQDPGGKLYHYNDGTYRARGERFIKGRCKALLDDWHATAAWSNHLSNELVEFIRIDAPELWDRPPDGVLAVANGLLDVKSRKLRPHSPMHLSAVQLPVTWDPSADCPAIKGFVQSTFPADAHDLAWESAAFAMLPSSLQKALLLLGEGANGKSVFLHLLTTFLGASNCSGLPLHRLESDKFAVARLIGKLANICPDLPSEHLAGTSIFKAIVGGDVMVAERKFHDSFEYSPFCKLIFSANHPPRSADASHAFFRRWVCIPFDRTFEEHEQIPRSILDAMLTEPKELSGLLNMALDAHDAMQDRGGFSEPESIKAAMQDFRATTDPLAVWLDQFAIEESDLYVPKSELRAAYNDHAAAEGRPPLGNKAFGTALRRIRPKIDDAQRMVAGRYAHCYVGIGLRSGGQP